MFFKYLWFCLHAYRTGRSDCGVTYFAHLKEGVPDLVVFIGRGRDA